MSDEILAEIQKFGGAPKRADDDIDYEMIQESLKCSYGQARRVGEKMVASGEYEKVQVNREDGRWINVFRKVG